MGSNWNYSCLWYLDLWFIKACLVGQCLWHIGQENPEVDTCLASTWFWTWDIFFELYPHSVHCQRPSSFLNIRLSTRMFRASIVSACGPSSRWLVTIYWSTLSISNIMLSVLMGHEGVASRTELLTDGALKTRSLQVLRFHMPGQSCTVLGPIITFTAIPHPIRTSAHLALDCRYQLLWIRFHRLFICNVQSLELAISKWMFVLLAVTLVYVTLQSIFCWTELIAIMTGIAIRLEVLCFNMVGKGCLVLCDKVTLTAPPCPVILLHHPLLNCFFQLIWARTISMHTLLVTNLFGDKNIIR